MTAVLDCVGILKICSYEARSRKVNKNASNCSVRLVFRAYIPSSTPGGPDTIVQSQSEPIKCVQTMGTPEISKVSLKHANANGGEELFILGRNFDTRDTVVVFREYKEDGKLAWSAEAEIEKPYLSVCHIVCIVPKYHNPARGATVSITVMCGKKSSHPLSFQLTANPVDPDSETPSLEDDDWRPPESPKHFAETKFEVPGFERYDTVSGYPSSYSGYGSGVPTPHSSTDSIRYLLDDEAPTHYGKRMKLGDDGSSYF
ncbi:hypothetical protein L596_008968 [Steinernema carpocapsae]|uniref:RHD domain-containing protein n=1 Tax=Steinernema carpocapsae TaxID=34508 RepID=A0A4U5PET8_STECR|nr:hypothetical protein L596_008968 [Steinernema carpocapsae]